MAEMDAPTTMGFDRTSDITLASYVLANHLAALKTLGGVQGRKVFVFDRVVDPNALIAYHTSAEKRVLDVFRALKTAVMTG
jgi:hypothetical protein